MFHWFARLLACGAILLLATGTIPSSASDSGAPGGFSPGDYGDGTAVGGELGGRDNAPAQDDRSLMDRLRDPATREETIREIQREAMERNAREEANKDLVDHITDAINRAIGRMRESQDRSPDEFRINPPKTGTAGGTRG